MTLQQQAMNVQSELCFIDDLFAEELVTSPEDKEFWNNRRTQVVYMSIIAGSWYLISEDDQ